MNTAKYGSVLDGYIVPGEPLISVKVTAYNHGKYIRQCLDGILMQKVNFPYEVLVHDDASPDDTADIIREYEARFPTVIKPIYQTENQYSKHDGTIGRIQNGRAKGKYIAQCEGDDYWTDPRKLQMQVDFLEGHEEYVGTAHNVTIVNETGQIIDNDPGFFFIYSSDFEYRLEHYQKTYKHAGQLNSLVYRNIFYELKPEIIEAYYAIAANGDRKLQLLLSLNGNMYCFGKTMSAYRYTTTSGTNFFTRIQGINRSRIIQKQWIEMSEFAEKYYNKKIPEFKKYASKQITGALVFFVRKRDKENFHILCQVASHSPHKIYMLLYILKATALKIVEIFNKH